ASQALAAGEGGLLLPTSPSVMRNLISSGAPVDFAVPDHTTGFENSVALSNPSKAPHPCAAELFLSYLMQNPGNKAFNLHGPVRGRYGVYDKLPGYTPPSADSVAQKAQIKQLLGR